MELEREKANVKNQLNMVLINAKRDKERHQAEKEMLEIGFRRTWEREKQKIWESEKETWEREKQKIWESEKETWEREKADLEKELNVVPKSAKHDEELHQAEKETLEIGLRQTWEREKADLKNQLNMLHIKAKHDKALRQAKKQLLEIKFLCAERRNVDLEASITRLRSTSNSGKSNPHRGSVSRAIFWEQDPVDIQVRPIMTKSNRLTPDEMEQLKESFDAVISKANATEIECYAPIRDAVNTFVPNIHCYDISKRDFPAGEVPDLSICLMRSNHAHPLLCYGIIEAKRPAEVLETSAHLGQVKDYILTLMQAQTSRTRFWGILTNMKANILIEIERGEQISGNRQHKIVQYSCMEWGAVMNYLRDVTSTEDLRPPPLYFAKELGDIQNIISSSQKWTLGEFYIPGDVTKTMVVKCSKFSPPQAYHRQELKVLQHLTACSKLNKAPSSIIKLVWDPASRAGDDCYEYLANDSCLRDAVPPRLQDSDPPLTRIQFGIAPVGLKFELDAFKTPADFQDAIDTLLDGLNWLHNTARVIHRDIRPANVIIDYSTKKPVIIDFDCAFLLQSVSLGGSQKAQLTTYSGGLICVPPEVLMRALEEYGRSPAIRKILYEPQAGHDLGALVLLVLSILFPKQFDRFPAYRLRATGARAEMEEMLNFHSGLAASSMWGTIWTGALSGNVEALKRIRDLGWWPDRSRRER
ncbi:hypothetical protein EV426DRAFT_646234 [Tirmania nivea]|nr:hypothetical protein EV426DRAFT_646234 [Tirmania nivea]